MFGSQDTPFRPLFEPERFEPASVTIEPPAAGAEAVPEGTLAELPTVDGGLDGVDSADWHAEAGRKGARRVHELIREGKLYEQEHGLKSGRQRLRQLIELGKLYEQEHGILPQRKLKSGRLSPGERQQLVTTLLRCLVRIAKPSFRAELSKLTAALERQEEGSVA